MGHSFQAPAGAKAVKPFLLCTWRCASKTGSRNCALQATTAPLCPGALKIIGGDDAQLGSGGYLVTGPTTGSNIVIDDNETMARNNGAISPLFVQADGGDVRIHGNQAEGLRVVLKDDGNVRVGTTGPQSTLQVDGYVQLDLTSGAPPTPDCNAPAEYERMKLDPIAGLLYICKTGGWVAK